MKSEILKMAKEGLDDIEAGFPLSKIIQKAVRIAKLKKDYKNLFWLEMELISTNDGANTKNLADRIKQNLSPTEYMTARNITVKAYISDRYISDRGKDGGILSTKTNIDSRGVIELENILNYFKDELENTKTPDGLHPVDLYFVEQKNTRNRTVIGSFIHEFEGILARIKSRVFQYLSDIESEIFHEEFNPEILEKDQKLVYKWLSEFYPNTMEKLEESKKRISEDTPETRTHALTSLRRVLKDTADIVYPSTDEVIKGDDGIERKMSDDKYLNRINQFISDSINDKSRRQLITANFNDFSNRLQKLNKLSNKGVHDQVSTSEVSICYKQTNFFIIEVFIMHIEKIDDDI